MLHENRDIIISRIMSRVLIVDLGFKIKGIPSPCWIWQGGHSGNGRGGGYGRMSLYGTTAAVHLIMYRLKKGRIFSGKQIDHMCNNRLCCNDDHLQMVSNLKNQQLRAKRAKEVIHVQCI